MQILITDIIDAAIIIGFIALFVLSDIFLKNRLKLPISNIGADLAIGAFVIQMAVLANLLTGENIADVAVIQINMAISLVFAGVWVLCVWLPTKNKTVMTVFSYIVGTTALAASTWNLLGTHQANTVPIITVSALGIGGIGFLIADSLYKEHTSQRFEHITSDTTAYDLTEACRKSAAGVYSIDPVQPAVDIIRGAIRDHDHATAKIGIRSISGFGTKVITGSKGTVTIAKHLDSHLYQVGVLAMREKESVVLGEVIDAIGNIGYTSSTSGSETAAVECLITIDSIFEALKKHAHDEKAQQKLAAVSGKIAFASAGSKQIDSVEKAVAILKNIGSAAAANYHDAALLEVKGALMEIAKLSGENELFTSTKQAVTALRDIGLKSSQEQREGKKPRALWEVISGMRELGESLGSSGIEEVIGALRDIGIAVVRNHSETEVSRVVTAIEHMGKYASQNGFDESASMSVGAIMELCDTSIKEQLKMAVTSSAAALSRLSRVEALSVVVNDAVFDLGMYKGTDSEGEMYSFFDNVYQRMSQI
ncbi:MAG TPA: hypothetical protein C5S51_12715 [Methanosarcinaceae archaeon]|nr:hypothetical protein [Methanosarcinaceae archaeon]